MKTVVKSIILLIVLVLAACGSEEVTDQNESTNSNSSETLETVLVGGRTGGAWSIFTEGIAESIRRDNDGSIITVEPGGIVENPVSVATNTIPYGLSYAMTAFAAYSGAEPYDQAYQDLRAISVVIPANYYQFIVRAETEYNSVKEIIENEYPIRLSVDQKGSAGEIITRNILKQYGVSYEDIISWGGTVDHLGGTKTFELMADKRIDAAGDALSVPSSDILEASTSIDLKLLSLEEDIAVSVAEDLGMLTGTIESGSYDFQYEEVTTVNTPVILIVNKDVSDEEVYKITESIYNNFDYLSTVHEEFKNLTAENMADVGSVPLHSGAEAFYKDKGLLE
ncbi:hypothetical protein GCM10011351_25130 [Paraliobacillus quinghaiensis]|uniref:TAXI family TRAP transporter solute-binding subunit n=1 Tax=Paraliobacillus quinghaiensis TaxID=470815 RepID=A0A917TVJ8_9BACI|nr:TAXI family TRAP transporter solute-binding subunit [Paraliobacillus quinghaiensis]GGM37906.1 hypothetical protein GCM10011351_25130 [Paraliobacillus quinghaiensis]